MNNQLDVQKFKEKLLEYQDKLTAELSTVGRINPDNPQDWEPTPGEKDDSVADKNDFADSIEEYESNTATLKELEIELNEVRAALQRIESGTYGICEESGEQIELERLEANPSARTCKAHMK
jgi:RNA polymerase-binding transcription factor DksA